MRVIAGSLRGRRLLAPSGSGTRPTTDRVREALFSVLEARGALDGDDVRVLDPFAGSGALGIEALSRGASHATFIELDRAAVRILRTNIEDLGVGERSRVLQADVLAVNQAALDGPFALILLDPPYRLDLARVSDLLAGLAARGSVTRGAFVSWEHSAQTEAEWPEGFEQVATKRYGTAALDVAVYERGAGRP